jgi:hypothetical protein
LARIAGEMRAPRSKGPHGADNTILEEQTVTTDAKNSQTEAKPDASLHYRPLGIKAVAAAAMMLPHKKSASAR